MLRLRAGAAIVEAGAAAREQLAMRPGFEVVDGRLLPREASARSAWLFAIRAVLQEGEPRLHWIPAGREAEAIALVPLPDETLFVRFERPLIAEWRTIRSFASACGLTRAEERVVVALCTGLSPKAIALRNGISEATVRSQIKGALEKAGSGGIRQLLMRLARLPSLACREQFDALAGSDRQDPREDFQQLPLVARAHHAEPGRSALR